MASIDRNHIKGESQMKVGETLRNFRNVSEISAHFIPYENCSCHPGYIRHIIPMFYILLLVIACMAWNRRRLDYNTGICTGTYLCLGNVSTIKVTRNYGGNSPDHIDAYGKYDHEPHSAGYAAKLNHAYAIYLLFMTLTYGPTFGSLKTYIGKSQYTYYSRP